MPAYNAEKYIKEAIESVLNQTISAFELIVIDDGSNDNTLSIVSELAKNDSRIKLIINDKNMGVARTRNRGMELSTGEYVAFLDSDDIWHSDKLEKQIELARKTGADIIYCSYALMAENGKSKYNNFIVSDKVSFHEMLTCNVLGCSTVLLSKQIAKNYRFDTRFYHEDYVLWLQIMRDGYKAAGVTECLVDYRVMESSRSSNKFDSAKKRWKIYRDFLNYSFVKCLYLSFRYALMGVLKYRNKK